MASTHLETNGRVLPLLRLGMGYGAVVDEATAVAVLLALICPHVPKKGADPTLAKLSFTVSADAPSGMRGLYLTRSTADHLMTLRSVPQTFKDILQTQLETP